jgi:hypothetical protein
VELPVEVMVTAVADTALVELVDPVAVTQSPTARLDQVADLFWVISVDESRVTVCSEAVVLPTRLPLTTSDDPATETTLPVTNETLAAFAGMLPPEPAPEPEGGVKLPFAGGAPPAPGPPAVAPPTGPPPPSPEAQVPEEEGEPTVMVRATILPSDVLPWTVTQSPGVREDDVRMTVRWKAVDGLQLTVFWPEEPCTSIEARDNEATFPDVPGNIRPEPEVPDDPPGAVEEAEPLDVLVEPPLQAARRRERDRATAAAERDRFLRVGTESKGESPCLGRGDIIRF